MEHPSSPILITRMRIRVHGTPVVNNLAVVFRKLISTFWPSGTHLPWEGGSSVNRFNIWIKLHLILFHFIICRIAVLLCCQRAIYNMETELLFLVCTNSGINEKCNKIGNTNGRYKLSISMYT